MESKPLWFEECIVKCSRLTDGKRYPIFKEIFNKKSYGWGVGDVEYLTKDDENRWCFVKQSAFAGFRHEEEYSEPVLIPDVTLEDALLFRAYYPDQMIELININDPEHKDIIKAGIREIDEKIASLRKERGANGEDARILQEYLASERERKDKRDNYVKNLCLLDQVLKELHSFVDEQ